jgi:4-carboxymuconolactone decarboxylase
MIAWIRNPELARRLQKLGELLRFSTSIEPALTEMAILVCARHWLTHLQWTAHKAKALNAGLSSQVVADIASGKVPKFDDGRAEVIYEISVSMLTTGRITDVLYARAVKQLDERGLVELLALLGYYCIASFTLNCFQLGLPAGMATELQDPDFNRQETQA